MFHHHPIDIYNIYIDAYIVSEIYRLTRVPTFLYIIIYVIKAALHKWKYRDSLLEKTLTTTATQACSHAQYNNIIYYTVSQVSNCNNNDGMCIYYICKYASIRGVYTSYYEQYSSAIGLYMHAAFVRNFVICYVFICIVHCYIIYNAADCVSSPRIYRIRSKFTFLQAHPDARAVSYSFEIEIEIVVIFTFSSLIAGVICFATE